MAWQMVLYCFYCNNTEQANDQQPNTSSASGSWTHGIPLSDPGSDWSFYKTSLPQETLNPLAPQPQVLYRINPESRSSHQLPHREGRCNKVQVVVDKQGKVWMDADLYDEVFC